MKGEYNCLQNIFLIIEFIIGFLFKKRRIENNYNYFIRKENFTFVVRKLIVGQIIKLENSTKKFLKLNVKKGTVAKWHNQSIYSMDIHDIFTVYCEISTFCNSPFKYNIPFCFIPRSR